MKKTLLYGLLSAIIIMLAACAGGADTSGSGADVDAGSVADADGGSAELANPVVAVDGPEAIAEQIGLKLAAPATATNADYSIIDGEIAQCAYTDTVDGVTAGITARAKTSNSYEDIAGDYTEYVNKETGDIDGVSVDVAWNDGGTGYASWYNENAGISGSVQIDSGADVAVLTTLASYYIDQEK